MCSFSLLKGHHPLSGPEIRVERGAGSCQTEFRSCQAHSGMINCIVVGQQRGSYLRHLSLLIPFFLVISDPEKRNGRQPRGQRVSYSPGSPRVLTARHETANPSRKVV
jgi:hypothetical protein